MPTARTDGPIRIVVIDASAGRPPVPAGHDASGTSAVEVVATGLPSAVLGLRAVDPDLILLRGGATRERAELVASVRRFEAATSRRRIPVVVEEPA